MLNRIEIALHHNRGESYRITSVAASYISLMYGIVGYVLRGFSHRPQLWRCTSLVAVVELALFSGRMKDLDSVPVLK